MTEQAAKKDRDAARRQERTILEKGTVLQKVTPPILAIIAVLGTIGFFYMLVFQRVEGGSKDIVLYMLGVLSTIVSQIFSYYFGSSAGSKAKQEQIHKQMNGNK